MTTNLKHSKFKILVTLCLAGLLMGSGSADTVLLTDGSDATYLIKGSFEVRAKQSQVWGVLTDYDGLSGIVSTLAKSEVIQRQTDIVLVRQTARGRFLFFHRDIPLLLRITEDPMDSLAFTEISKKTFKDYAGTWKLQDLSGTVKVDYQLQVSRGSVAPAFIERGLFQGNAQSLLNEMKREIGRRVQARAAACGVSTSAVAASPQFAALHKPAE